LHINTRALQEFEIGYNQVTNDLTNYCQQFPFGKFILSVSKFSVARGALIHPQASVISFGRVEVQFIAVGAGPQSIEIRVLGVDYV
jgi:hypothetical protein